MSRFKDLTRTGIFIRLLIFALVYGIFLVNYIDLMVYGSQIAGYYFWLPIMYFVPFVPIVAMYGIKDWELVGAFGLLASLCNDLLWQPVNYLANMIGVTAFPLMPLGPWYVWQLGFDTSGYTWLCVAGPLSFQVSSLLMGISIYARIVIVALLIHRWWKTP